MKFFGAVAHAIIFLSLAIYCRRSRINALLVFFYPGGVCFGVNSPKKRGIIDWDRVSVHGDANEGRLQQRSVYVSLNQLADWSYRSHLSLFVAPESNKFYILVDNRPWLEDIISGPAHFWQLMVTKSRLSPFANTRGRKGKKEATDVRQFQDNPKSGAIRSKRFRRWFSLIDASTLSQKRTLLPVKKLRDSLLLNSKLHRTLYGFIVFEVAWNAVRGLNYLNELQTDTSLTVEAKLMNRWEFDSLAQASKFLSSWFPGTSNERILFKEYLESLIGDPAGDIFYDAEENFPSASCTDYDNSSGDPTHGQDEPSSSRSSFSFYSVCSDDGGGTPRTPPPPDGPCKRRKVMRSIDTDYDFDAYSSSKEETYADIVGSPIYSLNSDATDFEDIIEDIIGPTQYKDVLLLFRFKDRDLPFKLKDIIMADLRLLTLLEAGLPSWVIFLQSYPGFNHLYRPWMCLLARALYVLISVITVLIGFYDLYKNVPLLKATASHLFGPLFDWIETWEMVSRIKYLGTMLFLHNCQKAVKWFLMMTCSLRSSLSFLIMPMSGPFLELMDLLLPFWNMSLQIVESLFSVFWVIIESSCSLFGSFVEIILMPFCFILSLICSIVTSILCPIFWIFWEMLYAPIRLIAGLYTLIVSICSFIYGVFGDMWLVASDIFRFSSGVKSTVGSTDVSMWRSLWNDLFSQIFRAVRSILNGVIAFFAACNRHRLSIYNHSLEFIRRFHQLSNRSGTFEKTERSGPIVSESSRSLDDGGSRKTR